MRQIFCFGIPFDPLPPPTVEGGGVTPEADIYLSCCQCMFAEYVLLYMPSLMGSSNH